MRIRIDWQRPVQLTKHKKVLVDEEDLPQKIHEEPGVYFFSRKFGAKFEPFYIGETLDIRHRLKTHLQSKKIAFVLLDLDPKSEVKGGTRYFHFGYVRTAQGQKAKTCIKVVQKYLIRRAIADGMTLVNKNLTTMKTHMLTFDGSKIARGIYPKRGSVER